MEPELKREIIMENYLHPFNKEMVEDERYVKVNTNNESCIDNIDLYILFDKNVIKDIKFQGEACAISTSATSIMIKKLIGCTIDEAINIAKNYDNMINERPYDSELLGEALCYDDIHKQQNRKTCAILPWVGLEKGLKKYQKSQEK
ncbi:MAG: Fe-S cluster assembly sulfur transfer protein SufU [Bacilli bacterium]